MLASPHADAGMCVTCRWLECRRCIAGAGWRATSQLYPGGAYPPRNI
jgi:hypothetical protein